MIGPEEVVSEQRRELRRNGVVWLVVALILAMVLGFAYRTDRRADKGEARLTGASSEMETLRGQVSANGEIAQSAKAAAEEANRRLAAAGKPTVPVPTAAPISPTVQPSAGVTDLQVRSIVSSAIAAYSPTLTPAQVEQIARVTAPKVPRPKDGTSPTPETLRPLVMNAVASYCTEDRCVGKMGPAGKDAPPVTDERLSAMIDQSLAAYCAKQPGGTCEGQAGADGTNGLDGKDGINGKDGADGKDGRGIADTDCQDDGTWLISYTDGTTDTARGPCRIVVAPPEPTDPPPEAKKTR